MTYRTDDGLLPRLLARGKLGDGRVRIAIADGRVRFERGWRGRTLAAWSVVAIMAAGVLAFLGTIDRVVSVDEFLTGPSLAAWMSPSLLFVAVGYFRARPYRVEIDRARGVRARGALAPVARVVLTRCAADDGSWARLAVRSAGGSTVTLAEIERLSLRQAARCKAIALALAAWLGAGFAEDSSAPDRERLYDADAALGLEPPREPAALRGPSPWAKAAHTAGEVVEMVGEILKGLS